MKPLNTAIDYTLLKADATAEKIARLCDEAKGESYYAVCVNPFWVQAAKERLKGSSVKIAAVVGFPLGATFPEVKALEAALAATHGADEIDMVLNIGALKDKNYPLVHQDIEEVVKASGLPVKVILECALLTEEEKKIACQLAAAAGAHFVKTSTGFGPAGASLEDVKLMKGAAGPHLKVKASGGIKDSQTAQAFLEAGADRIGTSSKI